jgi:hypothetical protein
MINQLFEHPYALNRYLTGPLLEERSAYLYHCAEQGFAKSSLRLIAHYQLVITDYLDLQNARAITPPEIEAAADRWAQRPFQARNPNVTFSLASAVARELAHGRAPDPGRRAGDDHDFVSVQFAVQLRSIRIIHLDSSCRFLLLSLFAGN